MSNQLHETATRVVSIALFPVLLAIGGVLVWVNQPLPVTTAVTSDFQIVAGMPAEELLPVAEPIVTVGPVTQVVKPVPIAPKPLAAAPVVPKTRHCEEYGMDKSGDEKVLICQWQ